MCLAGAFASNDMLEQQQRQHSMLHCCVMHLSWYDDNQHKHEVHWRCVYTLHTPCCGQAAVLCRAVLVVQAVVYPALPPLCAPLPWLWLLCWACRTA